MGQILHGCATMTGAVHRAIQNSQESLRALAKRYGINQKTVAKWKKRTACPDQKTGPRDPKSTALTEEAVIVAFRKHALLRSTIAFKHPWTNGQVERMNRTIKEATVKRYHYDHHDQLEIHFAGFIDAYNFGRRLKTLKGLTPCEFIVKARTKEPERFELDPIHQMPGLNSPGQSHISSSISAPLACSAGSGPERRAADVS